MYRLATVARCMIEELPHIESRVIGDIRGSSNGPTIICVASLHGNEPGGRIAARRILKALEKAKGRFAGRFLALAGNLGAIRANKRFLDDDFNRFWTEEHATMLRNCDQSALLSSAEGREYLELFPVIDAAIQEANGNAFVLDLHSTSSESVPFGVAAYTKKSVDAITQIPIPAIYELEQFGGLWQYFDSLGIPSMVIEGGQHLCQYTAHNHEASVWVLLNYAGCLLDDEEVSLAMEAYTLLADRTSNAQLQLEVYHRHGIEPDDCFAMEPGFQNFDRITKGQKLAVDKQGDIVADEDAILWLPLYQQQGDDGFFLLKEWSGF